MCLRLESGGPLLGHVFWTLCGPRVLCRGARAAVLRGSWKGDGPTLNVFEKCEKMWGKGHVTVSCCEGCVFHNGAQKQDWEGRIEMVRELLHVGVGTAVLCSCLHFRGF